MDEQHPSNLLSGQQVPDVDDDALDEPVEQSRLEYLNAVNPRPKRRLWLRILVAVIVLALLAGAGYFAYKHYSKKPAATKTASASQQTKQDKPADVTVSTAHYDSSNFNLGFDYPDKWTVADPGNGKLTVTSPPQALKTAAGDQKQVQIILSITPKGQNLAAFDKGSAVAVRNSEKIKYTNPTSVQRGETYMSFVQYAASSGSKSFDAIYITGDFGYKTGQYVPKVDMAKLDPVLAVTFLVCGDVDCKTTSPVGLSPDEWDQPAFKKPIETMLKSLSVN